MGGRERKGKEGKKEDELMLAKQTRLLKIELPHLILAYLSTCESERSKRPSLPSASSTEVLQAPLTPSQHRPGPVAPIYGDLLYLDAVH